MTFGIFLIAAVGFLVMIAVQVRARSLRSAILGSIAVAFVAQWCVGAFSSILISHPIIGPSDPNLLEILGADIVVALLSYPVIRVIPRAPGVESTKGPGQI